MENYNHFHKGGGCFVCSNCKKLTRQTTDNNANKEYCENCINEMELENELMDRSE